MASKVDICNFALQELGADTITSLNEGTPAAVECNLRYDSARRALLEMHQWNFAIKRAKLNADVAAPEFNYGKQYTLPANFTEISISHWGMFTVPEPQLEEPEAVAELPKYVLLPDWIDPEIRERVYAEMFA